MVDVKTNVVKYELFYDRVSQILEEGKEVIKYLSGSVITREAGEVQQAYYNLDGMAASIACGILMHIMNLTRVIKYMDDEKYGEDIGINDGDMFMNNDAYIGGMHVPDMGILAPYFYKGEHLGYIGAISHTTETGGIEPGGATPSAKEVFHDGTVFPVVRLVEKGKIRRDILNMARRAVRTPLAMELDIKARISGNERVRRRLDEMLGEFGVEYFKAATRQLVIDSEIQARERIKKLRPGVYSSRCYTDCVGSAENRLAVVRLEMEVSAEGELAIRIPEVSPQFPCFNNCYFPAVEATAFYILLEKVFYDMRWNSGVASCIKFEILEKSRLSADPNLSVGYCTIGIANTFASALTECLDHAYYVSGREEEVDAPCSSLNFTALGGVDQWGRPAGNAVMSIGTAAGAGGRIGKDGIDTSVNRYNPWSRTPDVEGEEALLPIIHLSQTILLDSGGFGKWRGGSGITGIYMIHGSDLVFPVSQGGGEKISSAQGLYGGYPACASFCDQKLNTDFYERVKKGAQLPYYSLDNFVQHLNGEYLLSGPNVSARATKAGDCVCTMSTGGTGLGDPIERDPELIVRDIKNLHTTVKTAQKMYCVDIDAATLKIDYESTERMRKEMRKKRIEQGIPARQYLKALVSKRNNDELPEVALSFFYETYSYSPKFKEEADAEERLLEKELRPLQDVKPKRDILKLTPYVKIVEDERGKLVNVCSSCGFGYCDARENFKLYSLIYERDPAEIHEGRMAYDKEWCIFREFYCPGCGTQIEVEAVPPGNPILHNVKSLTL